MHQYFFARQKLRMSRQDGIALITTVLVLVLVAATAIAAISNSEEEFKAGGRSRAVFRSLYAAEAGVQFAENRILPPRDLTAFSFNLNSVTIESRKRDDTTTSPIVPGGLGKPPPGYSINIGAGFANEIFEVNVTAEGASVPTSEIEVRLGLLTSNTGVN